MAQTQWEPGLAAPRLAADVVDVWLADLDGGVRGGAGAGGAADAAGGDAHAPLTPEERERAARFVRPGDGERWAAARGILRALLAAYAGADPRELRLVAGPHGKPALAGAPHVRFNLSHSAGVALYAFALDRDVGVDVELPRRAVDHVGIARRTLGEAEAERLSALEAPRREREFLRAWVRWEAVLKCRGTGIGGADAAAADGEPWVCELEIGGPGAAALAVAGGRATVRRFRWPPVAP